MIQFHQVGFIRDGCTIIENVTFQINEGEHWAILGPNGSGKSTLFSMLMAYTIASKGDIDAFGIRFGEGNWNEVKEKIGIVSSTMKKFEPVFNRQSVFDIVLSGLKKSIGIYEDVRDDEIVCVDEWLADYEMDHLRDRTYQTLSSGEKQKTMILRSLIASPKVLILDEPCISLDLYQREIILNTLTQVQDTQLIYITHDVSEILPKITHIMLFKDGKIFNMGLKEEMLIDANLSALYGVDVLTDWHEGRIYLKMDKRKG